MCTVLSVVHLRIHDVELTYLTEWTHVRRNSGAAVWLLYLLNIDEKQIEMLLFSFILENNFRRMILILNLLAPHWNTVLISVSTSGG
jgi:hypothetical protein